MNTLARCLSNVVRLAPLAAVIVAVSCSNKDEVRGLAGDTTSLARAVGGTVDNHTARKIQVLALVLDARDWTYLARARWPEDDGTAALNDPTLQKAALALAPRNGNVRTASSDSSTSLGVRFLPTGGPTYSAEGWRQVYPEARGLLKDGYAATPAVVAEWASLLAGVIVASEGSPLPDPKTPVDPVLDGCGKYFYEGSGPAQPTCDTIDFCCKGEIDLQAGVTICADFASCRGKPPPPNLSTKSGGGAAADAGSSYLAPVADCDAFKTQKTGKPPPVRDPNCLLNCESSFKDSCAPDACFVYDTAGLSDQEIAARLPPKRYCLATPWYDAPGIPDTFKACCISK